MIRSWERRTEIIARIAALAVLAGTGGGTLCWFLLPASRDVFTFLLP